MVPTFRGRGVVDELRQHISAVLLKFKSRYSPHYKTATNGLWLRL
jgi:hypothetical protein